jgi:peptidyl-prolyl cis-trans isomerase C
MDLRKILLIVWISLFVPLVMAEELDPVVGKVGEYVIKQSSLERLVGVLSAEGQRRFKANPQQKVTIVKRMLVFKVIADKAKKEGFDQQAEIKERLELMVNNYLAQEYLKKKVLQDVTVTEEEMNKYYTANEKRFTVPEQVRVKHILIRVSPKAQEDEKRKAKERAEDLLKKIKEGEDFGKLAGKFSDDPNSKKKQGDLGFLGRGRMLKAFEDAAFALKPGQVSDVIETQMGYHLIKMEDHQAGGIQPYEEVKERIQTQLKMERGNARTEEFTKRVEEEAGLEVYPEKIPGEEQNE